MVIDMHDFDIKHTAGIALIVFSLFGLLTLNVYAVESRGISIEKTAKSQSSNINSGVYRALVIGNNEYNDKQGKWDSLSTAVTDAREVARLLNQQQPKAIREKQIWLQHKVALHQYRHAGHGDRYWNGPYRLASHHSFADFV